MESISPDAIRFAGFVARFLQKQYALDLLCFFALQTLTETWRTLRALSLRDTPLLFAPRRLNLKLSGYALYSSALSITDE